MNSSYSFNKKKQLVSNTKAISKVKRKLNTECEWACVQTLMYTLVVVLLELIRLLRTYICISVYDTRY